MTTQEFVFVDNEELFNRNLISNYPQKFMSKKIIHVKKNRKLSETVKNKLNSMIGKNGSSGGDSRMHSPLK